MRVVVGVGVCVRLLLVVWVLLCAVNANAQDNEYVLARVLLHNMNALDFTNTTQSLLISQIAEKVGVHPTSIQIISFENIPNYLSVEIAVFPEDGGVIGRGNGIVSVELPKPISVTVSASRSQITRPSDAATGPGLAIPTSSSLTITVQFEGGSQIDFTNDPRTFISISSGNSLAFLEGATVKPNTTATTVGTVSISVSFSPLFSLLSKTISISVIALSHVTVSAVSYPSNSPISISQLAPISCSGAFERATPIVTAFLTTGSSSVITSYSTVQSSNTAVATVSGSGSSQRIVGVASGSTTLTATYQGVASSGMVLTVVSTPVEFQSVEITNSLTTLSGTKDSKTEQLKVKIVLTNGVTIDDSSQLTWVDANSLFHFISSVPSSASVTPVGGLVTLKDNYYSTVEISVSGPTCVGSGTLVKSDSIDIFCNLVNSVDGDVDLGSTSGSMFPTISVGQSFTMNIYIDSSSSVLRGFELTLTFNSTALRAQSCTKQSGWGSGFQCTINDPIDQIFIVGSDLTSTAKSANIFVASVVLQAQSSGLAEISGTLATVQTASGQICLSGCAVTVGHGFVQILPAKKEQKQIFGGDEEAILDSNLNVFPAVQKKRMLKSCTTYPMGDANLDCVFDVLDTLYVQEYYVGQHPDATALQIKLMDVTLNGGQPDGVDVSYLLSVRARKRRFLVVDTVDSGPFLTLGATTLTITVLVLDQNSDPATTQTTVKFEIGTVLNTAIVFSTGTDRTITGNGVMVTAVHIGGGKYQAVAPGPFVAESSVGFVVLLETQDSLGASAVDRRFPFFGTNTPPYDASGFSYNPFQTLTFASFSASITPSSTLSPSTTPSTSKSPSRSPSPTTSASASPSISITPSVSPTATTSPSQTSSATTSSTPSRTPTASVSILESPSTSATTSPTPSTSASATVSASQSSSRSATPSISATASISRTASASRSATRSVSATQSVSASSSVSPSMSSSVSATPSFTASPTQSRSATISSSVSPSPTTSSSASQSASTTPSSSVSPTTTPSSSVSPTASRSASVSPTVSRSASVTPTSSVSPTASESVSPSSTGTKSATPSASASSSVSSTASVTPSASPSVSATPSRTPSASASASSSVSASASRSSSNSRSPTASTTASRSPTPSRSASPSSSVSVSLTASTSESASTSPSPSISATPSRSSSESPSSSASPTVSASASVTSSASTSASTTASVSASPTSSPTSSVSPSATRSPTPSLSTDESPSTSASQTQSSSISPSATVSPSFSPSSSASPSTSASTSSSSSATPSTSASSSTTPSASVSATASLSSSFSASTSPTHSPSASASNSPSVSPTLSISATSSATSSISLSSSPSITTTSSATPSPTNTRSSTPSRSASPTVSPTRTASPSASLSKTTTPSASPSRTASPSASPSRSGSPTASVSGSSSPSSTTSPSPSPSTSDGLYYCTVPLSQYNRELTSLAQVSIAESSADGIGFPVVRNASNLVSSSTYGVPSFPGRFERDYTMFVQTNPSVAASSTLNAQIGTLSTSAIATATATFSRVPVLPAATVSAIVKTQILWVDDQRFQAQYYVQDVNGRAQVLQTGISVRAVLDSPTTTATVTCSSPSSSSGVGSCATSSVGVSSWFSTLVDVTISARVQVLYSGLVVCESASRNLTLTKQPIVTASSSLGITASLPRAGWFPADTFLVTLTANTGVHSLSTWGVELTINTTIVDYVTTSLISSSFDSPLVNADGTSGVISMVCSAKNGAVVTGSSVSLVSVTLRVRSVPAGLNVAIVSALVRDMVNLGGFKFVDHVAIGITDHRGSGQSTAEIFVLSQKTIGAYAYATTSEMINVQVIANSTASRTMSASVMAVDNKYGTSDVDVTSSSTCTLDNIADAQVVTISGCNMLLTSGGQHGSSSVVLRATFNGMSTTLRFRVWFPYALKVNLDDTELRRIRGTSCNPIFQTTFATAHATVRTDASPAISEEYTVDVTAFVQLATLTANSPFVNISTTANKNRFLVAGVSPGTEWITASFVSPSVSVSPAAVSVVSQKTVVSSLDVVLVTGAVFNSLPSSVSAINTTVSPVVTLKQQLLAEGSSGSVFVFANFDDGTRMDVSRTAGVNVTSAAPTTIGVSGTVSSGYTGVVPFAATSACGLFLEAEWITCHTPTFDDIVLSLANITSLVGTDTNVTVVSHSPSPSFSSSSSMSISITPSATPSATASPSPSATASTSTSATTSMSASSSTSATVSVSSTATVSATSSSSPSSSVSSSASVSASVTPTSSVSPTTSATSSASTTVSPTSSVSPTTSATSSMSATSSTSPTASLSGSSSMTMSPTATTSVSASASVSATASLTSSATATASSTASVSETASVSPSSSSSASPTMSATRSASVTSSPSPSPTSATLLDRACDTILANYQTDASIVSLLTNHAEATLEASTMMQPNNTLFFAVGAHATQSQAQYGKFSRAFVSAVAQQRQQQSLSVQATGSGIQTTFATGQVQSVPSTPPTVSAVLILKTQRLFAGSDMRFHAVLAIVDSRNRTYSNTSAITAQVEISNVDTGATIAQVACVRNTQSPELGLFDCMHPWLVGVSSSASQVNVRGVLQSTTSSSQLTIASASTATQLLSIVAQPVFTALDMDTAAAGVLSFPTQDLYPGDSVQVTVNATTANSLISGFGLEIRYNSSLLEFVSLETEPSVFRSPETFVDSANGIIRVATFVRLDGGVKTQNNTLMPLAWLAFSVRNSAPAGVHNNAMSGSLDLLTIFNNLVADKLGLLVWDSSNANQPNALNTKQARLTIKTDKPAGVTAYTQNYELINWAMVGGADLSQPVFVFAHPPAYNTQPTIISTATCSLSESAVVQVDNCVLRITAQQTHGAEEINVSIDVDGVSTTLLPLRVWIPVNVSVEVAKATLRQIQGTACSNGTARYQQTVASVWATLQATTSATSRSVDITSTVGDLAVTGAGNVSAIVVATRTSNTRGFVLTVNPQSAAMDAVVTASISIRNASPSVVITPAVVSVSAANPVSISALYVSAVSSALFTATPQQIAAPGESQITAALVHNLKFDGDTSAVYVTAVFTDGSQQMLRSPHDSVTVWSSNSSIAAVTDSTWVLTVPANANRYCGTILHAQWSACGNVLATGNGAVFINAASPTVVHATLSTNTITTAGAPASQSPISIAVRAVLSVSVGFSDGSLRDMTNDARLQVEQIAGVPLVRYQDGALLVTNSSGVAVGVATLRVTFAQVSATVQVQVVHVQRLDFGVADATGALSSMAVSLRQIRCLQNTYQRAELVVVAHLSDSRNITLAPQYTTMSSSNTSVATTVSGWVVGLALGSADLVASFGTISSSAVHVSVVANTTAVTSISLQITSAASLGFVSNTLLGVQGSTAHAAVHVLFDDKTEIQDIFDNAWAWWFDPTGLVSLSSSVPNAVSIDGGNGGTVTLLSNHYAFVDITAQATACVTENTLVSSSTLSVAANLLPQLIGDVDVGNTLSLPLDSASLSTSAISVPIRIHAPGGLSAFQFQLLFNETQLQATSCSAGAEWTEEFTCTMNDPVSTVYLIGAAPRLVVGSGEDVHVATVVLKPRISGVHQLSGVITRVVAADQGGSSLLECSVANPCAFGPAGQIAVSVGSTKQSMKQHSELNQMQTLAVRKQQSSECTVLGDTNADCVFDVVDVLVGLKLYTGSLNVDTLNTDGTAATAWQLQQLDPQQNGFDASGRPGLGDVRYLLNTLAKKYRFVSTWTATSEPGRLLLQVAVVDEKSQPIESAQFTKVKFVIATKLNANVQLLTVGQNGELTDEGVVCDGELKSGGIFQAEFSGFTQPETDVGVAFVIFTFDATGQGSLERASPFHSTNLLSPAYTTFQPISTVNLALVSPTSTTSATATPSPSSSASTSASPSTIIAQSNSSTTSTVGIAAGVSGALAVLAVGAAVLYCRKPQSPLRRATFVPRGSVTGDLELVANPLRIVAQQMLQKSTATKEVVSERAVVKPLADEDDFDDMSP